VGLKKDPLERDEFVFFDFLQKNQKKQIHLSPPLPLAARFLTGFIYAQLLTF
jgi:hypothetical protein